MPDKSALKSKTIWVQVVTFLAILFPPVQQWLAENPVEFIAALGAVNVLVRFVTKGKITLFADGDGTGGGRLPVLLITLAAAIVLLPGCVVGVDGKGDWTLRTDPKVIDTALDYLIKHDAKGWNYYDAETGDLITPDEFPAYGIEP